MITVALDLDETFLVSAPAMAAILLEETGAFVDPATWDNYNLAKVWMTSGLIGDRVITNEEVMGWFVKHNLMERCRLAPGAMETYEFCRQRNIGIEFVTARGFDPMARARTLNMLRNSGVRGGFDLTIVPDMGPKRSRMRNPKPTLFVDDNPTQVLDMRDHASHSLLVAHPHNAKFRQDRIRHNHLVQTVHSMWDVLDILPRLNADSILAPGIHAKD